MSSEEQGAESIEKSAKIVFWNVENDESSTYFRNVLRFYRLQSPIENGISRHMQGLVSCFPSSYL